MACLGLVACTSSPSRTGEDFSSSDEYSLKEDRQALDQLRKDIPEPIKRDNDELALILNLMKQDTAHPSEVRNKYQSLERKKRTLFMNHLRKLRDQFTQSERNRRDRFRDAQKEQRDQIPKNSKREQRQKLFDDMDRKRREFYDDERDKRKVFESDMQQKSKDFYAEIRETSKNFYAELKSYQKRWNDAEGDKRRKRKQQMQGHTEKSNSPSSQPKENSTPDQLPKELQEYYQLQEQPGKTIKSGD